MVADMMEGSVRDRGFREVAEERSVPETDGVLANGGDRGSYRDWGWRWCEEVGFYGQNGHAPHLLLLNSLTTCRVKKATGVSLHGHQT